MHSTKVVLTGSYGVGKTSLFNQFLDKKFKDHYLTTIGVKVDKKIIEINGQSITILLWDIAGEQDQQKVPSSYFLGASSIIYVIDLTRPSTYANMDSNLEHLKKINPSVQFKIVANKKDLVGEEDIKNIIHNLNYEVDLVTSAKTGENVEELFMMIGLETIAIR